MQSFCVLLYSKYSPYSTQLLDIVNRAPVDLASIMQLKTVCIDNQEVREWILCSDSINVNQVPCVLRVFPDGGVEQYESNRAFDLVNTTIQAHAPPPPQPVAQPVARMTSQEETSSDEEAERVIRRAKKKKARKKKAVEVDVVTALEDLDTETEDEEYEAIQRPPVAVRRNDGGYDMTDEFGEAAPQNRSVSRGIKTPGPTGGSKKENLMAAAMAMQKSRETDDSALRPQGAPPDRL